MGVLKKHSGVRKIMLGVRNCIKIGHSTHLVEMRFEILLSNPIFDIMKLNKITMWRGK